jgi:hypothetical protein
MVWTPNAVSKQWDESKLKAYPAGTLYSEPQSAAELDHLGFIGSELSELSRRFWQRQRMTIFPIYRLGV